MGKENDFFLIGVATTPTPKNLTPIQPTLYIGDIKIGLVTMQLIWVTRTEQPNSGEYYIEATGYYEGSTELKRFRIDVYENTIVEELVK